MPRPSRVVEMPVVALLIAAPPENPRAYEGPTAVAVESKTPKPEVDGGLKPLRKLPARPVKFGKKDERPGLLRASAAIDLAYAYNSAAPDNHVYRGMVPTPRTGEFALNVVSVGLDKEAADGSPWRMQLLLHAGSGVDALIEPEPVIGGDDGRFAGPEAFKHIGLANLGFKARSGTSLDVGLQPAPLGTEWFWPHRNWLHTASWTANGTPFYLMGAHLAQELPRGFRVFGWVVNGWQTLGEANNAPSYLVGFGAEPGDGMNAAVMVYFGPEDRVIAPEAWRVHTDAFLVYETPRGGIGVVWDFGRERLVELANEPVALWTSGALFGRVRAVDRKRWALDIAARPEAWWDRDGRIYGAEQLLLSGTANVSATLFDALLFRLEYRYDRSSAADGFFFRQRATNPDATGLGNEQHIVMLSASAFVDYRFKRRQPQQ